MLKKKAVPYSTHKKAATKDNSSQKVTSGIDKEENFCDVCKRVTHELFQCEHWLLWHCFVCAKLAVELMAFLEDYKSLHWFCSLCNPTMSETIQACSPSPGKAIETTSKAILFSMKKTLDSRVIQLNSMIEETKEQLRHSLKEVSQQSHVMDTSESIPKSLSLYQVPAQQVVQMVDNYFDRQ